MVKQMKTVKGLNPFQIFLKNKVRETVLDVYNCINVYNVVNPLCRTVSHQRVHEIQRDKGLDVRLPLPVASSNLNFTPVLRENILELWSGVCHFSLPSSNSTREDLRPDCSLEYPTAV
ncbi:hypothetical protein TNCV_4730441 [Trichonephila clavipes]|nr:hypothetical protein TNCV_4730441 [Trichonephila clavipes]